MYIDVSNLTDAQVHQINTFYLKTLGRNYSDKIFECLLVGEVNETELLGKRLVIREPGQAYVTYFFRINNRDKDFIVMESSVAPKRWYVKHSFIQKILDNET